MKLKHIENTLQDVRSRISAIDRAIAIKTAEREILQEFFYTLEGAISKQNEEDEVSHLTDEEKQQGFDGK